MGVWTAYTPSIGGTTTAPTLATTHTKNANYMVLGKSLFINWLYNHTFATGSTAGAGSYTFNIPGGFTIDTSLVIIGTQTTSGNDYTPIGSGTVTQDGNTSATSVIAQSSTTLMLKTIYNSGPALGLVGNGNYTMTINNQSILFTAVIPVT